MKVVLLLVALVCMTAAQDQRQSALEAFNAARVSVNPPCDYRPAASPCKGRNKNALPPLVWSDDLEKASRDYAILCPASSNLNVAQGQTQLFIKSVRPNDQRTEAQTLLDFATQWSTLQNPGAYNAATGVAIGADGRAYKTVVNSANRRVGCAVNTNCAGGSRVVVCTFDAALPAGPAYPVLSKDASITNLFRDSIVTWVNRARSVAYPKPPKPLPGVSWDDKLAASAQATADRQTTRPAVYDPALSTVQTMGSLGFVQANPGFSFVATSFSRGVFYDMNTNTCRDSAGRQRRRCGMYTQLMGSEVTKIGCGLSWKNGNTFVVCQFDASYSNGGVATRRPY